MTPSVALILCISFVLWLLRLEKKRSPDTSIALWIPTIWLLLNGSKPLGHWFNYGGSDETGSPLDRFILSLLIFFALIVLAKKKIDYSRVLRDNSVIIIIYVFICLSSIWADDLFIALKRCIRIAGTIPIALILLTETSPFKSLESVLRRCAYVLIPFSILLIKYFPYLGVQFSRWEGELMWIGVGLQKNGLGALCAITVVFMIWTIIRDFQKGELFNNKLSLFSDIFVSGIALFIVLGPGSGRSATAVTIMMVGIVTLLLLYRMKNITKWIFNHIKLVLLLLIVMFITFNEILLPEISAMLGRNASLTGRTDIWQACLTAAAEHPILGYGYGGFWGLPNNTVSAIFDIKSAHNGYLDIYLQLGTVGIIMLTIFLLHFCTKIKKAYEHSYDWGNFGFVMLLIMLLSNYSESFFFQTGFLWTVVIYLIIVFTYKDNDDLKVGNAIPS